MWMMCAVLLPGPLFATETASINGEITSAVVKVYAVVSKSDYYRPWQQSVAQVTGSGLVISGNRILTNAHVVANFTYVEVRRNGEARRFRATVDNICHEADLALLTVDDPDFFAGITPLSFGGLPRVQEEVLVYGFPTGGDTLSITRGIVSRVEHVRYSHSSLFFLGGQIDAAINRGNSGGPVLADGKVVGVAMQGRTDADNIGYLIPVPVIEHFLVDIEDGHYDGFPEAGIMVQSMESPAMKRRYGMSIDQAGVLVRRIVPGAPAARVLEKGDVVMAVDGVPVADDGTVLFRPMERTMMGYVLDRHQIGDEVRFTVFRKGRKMDVSFILDKRADQLLYGALEAYDVLPRYLVFGGIVFSPLTKNLLLRWGNNWQVEAPYRLIVELTELPDETRREAVVALMVLPADVNRGYHDVATRIITQVNGATFAGFDEFSQLVREAKEEFVVFEDSDENQIVVDREKAVASHEDILATYRVTGDGSDEGPDRGQPDQPKGAAGAEEKTP